MVSQRSPLSGPLREAKGIPLVGSAFELRRKGLLPFVQDLHRQYGDLVEFRLGPTSFYLLCRPEHLYHVLIRNFRNYGKGKHYDPIRLLLGQGMLTLDGGEEWQQRHALLKDVFTPRASLEFTEMLVGMTQRHITRWEALIDREGALDVGQEMLSLTMGFISQLAFGIDLTSDVARQVGEAFERVFSFIGDAVANPFMISRYLPTPTHIRFKRSLRIIHDFVKERIDECRARPGSEHLLAMLARAYDSDSTAARADVLRDEAITLFFAGYESTARVLGWCLYALSQHPHVLHRLQEEVDTVLGQRPPSRDDISRLVYTRMVVEETMRLFPPGAVIGRQAREGDSIDGSPIPGGALLLLSPYIAHRHPEFWEDPNTFDPERFGPEQSKQRHKCAYLPFSSGPRICLGISFAMLELVVVIAMIAQRYELAFPRRDIAPMLEGTLRPSEELLMTVRRRKI